MKNLHWNRIAHIDLRYDIDGNLYIIEVNPRFWESLLASLSAGINFSSIMYDFSITKTIKQHDYKETEVS